MASDTLLALVGNASGRITPGFLISCLQAFIHRDIELLYVNDGPYVGRARNAVATHFLTKTQLPWLLFIDMDLVFARNDIDLLFESEEPIVAGVYYLKNGKRQVAAKRFPISPNILGRVEVARVATGFLRIHRSVFQRLTAHAESYRNYEGQEQWNFFPMPITDGELVSEDWGFCDFARQVGFRIFLDTRIQLKHEGSALYPL